MESDDVAARLARIEALLTRVHGAADEADPAAEQLRQNARLLALLRSHPPPRPPMLPNRRLRLAARAKWRCGICSELLSEAFDIDHVTPWCETFDDSDDNCVACCVACHRSKCSVEASARGRGV